MLNLTNVYNIDIEDIHSQQFDVGIFASGYESRSSFLARNLNSSSINHKIILGFEEHRDDDVRLDNDAYYKKHYNDPLIFSSQDQIKIYSELRAIFEVIEMDKRISILLDYTSMARLWYSGILNFLRFHKDRDIDIYLNYSVGLYKSNFLDYTYTSINSLPSLEGSLSSNNKTLLILAIGFSPYIIKSVVEEIEPNNIIGILPTPNVIPEYEEQANKTREELNEYIDLWMTCPVNNLETIFRNYAEITNSNSNEKDIIFLSLGPKIFTLASILVGQRFDQVTSLYLKSKRANNDVKPAGHFICNKLTYRPA